MNTTLIAMALALVLSLGLVITLGVVSLLTGAFNFLLLRPHYNILKSEKENGFAFTFRWHGTGDNATFDQIKIRLFNPFGSPTQIEVCQHFDGADSTFARDVSMGLGLQKILQAKNMKRASIQLEISSTRDAITYQFPIPGKKFKKLLSSAKETVKQWNEKNIREEEKTVFQTIERSFIAEPLPKGQKVLKLAANPVYAGQFANLTSGAAALGGGNAAESFAVSKVWIIEGCIVCNACEDIYPEVFNVTSDTCLVRDDYPKDDGMKVQEAAEACPVEVIKFTKA